MKERMERVEAIRRHPLYTEAVAQIAEAEKDRIYCGHSEEHFLDVARIMYIRKLEQGTDLSKEVLYATALLHDIGRAQQYTTGTPHDEAGVDMANTILPECGFTEEEIRLITFAIGDHRKKDDEEGAEAEESRNVLAALLKEADNLSRTCFSCKAEDTCKWSEERKNHEISL